MTLSPSIYGLLAEFDSADKVLSAAGEVRRGGYSRCEAYAPFPVEGLSQAIGFRHSRMPLLVLMGGVIGGLTGFLMQWYANVVSYPLIVAGRPFNSWPAWIPITFELTVLGAALFGVFGMLGRNGLPMPYHPVFNAPVFSLASRDRFFICIEAVDPKFDRAATQQFLESLQPISIVEVEP